MTDLQELHLHVLETVPAVHPARRARIFRALADIIGDETYAAVLIERAEAAEALQRADGQLALNFRRRNA